MKVGVISDSEYMGNVAVSGWHTAFKNCITALKLNRIDVKVNHLNDVDILHLHSVGPLALSAILSKPCPLVASSHITVGDLVEQLSFAEYTYPILDNYLKLIYTNVDAIIAPTEFTKDYLINKMGIKTKKIYVISNGIDLKKFEHNKKLAREFRKKFGIRENETMVYGVGHVVPRKGLYTFLKVAEAFPELKFVWVGKRKWGFLYKDHFRINEIIKNPPPNVIFTGYVTSRELVGAHSAGDIFLFPSQYENQGIVVLEAAAAGNALLLRDIPVYKSWLTHGKNCFLAKNDNEFKRYLKLLIAKNGMFKKETKKMIKGHDLKRVGASLVETYKEVIKNYKYERI